MASTSAPIMSDQKRWIANERLLVNAASIALTLRFLDVVKEMEVLGWRPQIMEVRRTWARHLILYARRVTHTFRSKHLTGKAMDVIDARYPWAQTPAEFMVDLAIIARKYGLTTGLLWDLTGSDRTVREAVLFQAVALVRDPRPIERIAHGNWRNKLIELISAKRGFDPCHVEVLR